MEPSFEPADRYLSLPFSRLVINPYAFEALDASVSQVAYTERPTLPLGIGYCSPLVVDRPGIEWPDALMLYEAAGEGGAPKTIWEAPLADASRWKEETGAPACRFCEGYIVLAVSPDLRHPPLHVLESEPIDCDLDRAVLTLSVGAMSAASSLAFKVTCDGWESNVCLLRTREHGVFSFALGAVCNRHGRQRVAVQVHILDGRGDVSKFYAMSVTEVSPAVAAASAYTCRWQPASLEWDATYPGGNRVTCTDYFTDEQTITRRITGGGTRPLVIAGRCFGRVSMLEGDRLRMTEEDRCAQIRLPAGCKPRFYPTLPHFLGNNGGSSVPGADCAVWAVSLPINDAPLTVSVTMGRPDDAPAFLGKPFTLEERRKQWDLQLSRIPLPADFTLRRVPSRGVTPQRLKQMYYAAWTQIIANILPPSRETAYPYASMATGKASLWAYGAPACSYAASWETFYGVMLYAQIEPERAWEMFMGLMTLVDGDGQLGGESLPSVKARTAWVLHRTAPDSARLSAAAPALERYLLWRLRNLRWIYLDKTPHTDERDLDFVASALIDIEYFRRICRELGKKEADRAWESRQADLYERMASWFFKDAPSPCQYYRENGGLRLSGNPLTILKALHVPRLRDAEESALQALFSASYHPEAPLGGFHGVKAENMTYTFYGLWERRRRDEAVELAEIAARDVTLSGFLAEEYDARDGVVRPGGVRPSIFGCALLIESLLFLNGSRLDGGPCPTQT